MNTSEKPKQKRQKIQLEKGQKMTGSRVQVKDKTAKFTWKHGANHGLTESKIKTQIAYNLGSYNKKKLKVKMVDENGQQIEVFRDPNPKMKYKSAKAVQGALTKNNWVVFIKLVQYYVNYVKIDQKDPLELNYGQIISNPWVQMMFHAVDSEGNPSAIPPNHFPMTLTQEFDEYSSSILGPNGTTKIGDNVFNHFVQNGDLKVNLLRQKLNELFDKSDYSQRFDYISPGSGRHIWNKNTDHMSDLNRVTGLNIEAKVTNDLYQNFKRGRLKIAKQKTNTTTVLPPPATNTTVIAPTTNTTSQTQINPPVENQRKRRLETIIEEGDREDLDETNIGRMPVSQKRNHDDEGNRFEEFGHDEGFSNQEGYQEKINIVEPLNDENDPQYVKDLNKEYSADIEKFKNCIVNNGHKTYILKNNSKISFQGNKLETLVKYDGWLSTDIVDVFAGYYNDNKYPDAYCFNHAEAQKYIVNKNQSFSEMNLRPTTIEKYKNKNLIAIPVHINNHWTVFILTIEFNEKTLPRKCFIDYYDSLHKKPPQYQGWLNNISSFIEFIYTKNELMGTENIKIPPPKINFKVDEKIPQWLKKQSDGYNCGIYILIIIYQMMKNNEAMKADFFTLENLYKFRIQLGRKILNASIFANLD